MDIKKLISAVDDPATALLLAKWLKAYTDTIIPEDGIDGNDGAGIAHISQTEELSFKIILTDGSYYQINLPAPLEPVSIKSLTRQDGNLKITLTDGRVRLFNLPKGDKGEKGSDGGIGPMPAHEWNGASIRFQQPTEDGQIKWGKWTDLRGPRGAGLFGGGGSGGTNLDSLPLTTNITGITEMIVKEGGQWKRLEVTMEIKPDDSCTFYTSDGELLITSDGEELKVICNG